MYACKHVCCMYTNQRHCTEVYVRTYVWRHVHRFNKNQPLFIPSTVRTYLSVCVCAYEWIYVSNCIYMCAFEYDRDRIKCPKNRLKTGLCTVEIATSFPPWIRPYSRTFYCVPVIRMQVRTHTWVRAAVYLPFCWSRSLRRDTDRTQKWKPRILSLTLLCSMDIIGWVDGWVSEWLGKWMREWMSEWLMDRCNIYTLGV